MLALLVVLSLVWLASCPSPSRKHPHLPQKQKPLKISVSPPVMNFPPGRKITFKCRVKGTYSVTQWPDIGFYMLLKKTTVMPLSSGTPGVSIRTTAVEGRPGTQYRRTVTRLTLHPEIYPLLQVGENYFCCKAFLSGNDSAPVKRYVDYFVVRKKARRRGAKR